jgi:hypothetical protein
MGCGDRREGALGRAGPRRTALAQTFTRATRDALLTAEVHRAGRRPRHHDPPAGVLGSPNRTCIPWHFRRGEEKIHHKSRVLSDRSG